MLRALGALFGAMLVVSCAAAPPAETPRSPEGFAYLSQPLVRDIYVADPSAHVFNGRIYVYGSHDIDAKPIDTDPGRGYVMRDYRPLSMARIGGPVTVHPVALALEHVPWADRMLWAPDAASKGGRYYLYFPAKDRDGVFRIGVAVGDHPEGPFRAEPQPISGSYSIDPAVFTDDDGRSYLYFGGIHGGQLQRWANGRYDPKGSIADLERPNDAALTPKVARLADDMLSFAEPVRDALINDEKGRPLLGGDLDRRFFEGVWMHKYRDVYYLSYSTGDTHYLVYATAASPYGPFTFRGRFLAPVQGWTTHHSIVEFRGRWYLFYHDTQLSNRTNLRNTKVTELVHEADGSIRPIDPFVRQR